MVDTEKLTGYMDGITREDKYCRVRLLSIFSGVITLGKIDLMKNVLSYFKSRQIDQTAIYETILQSYLFLGFPRMIEAGLAFNAVYGDIDSHRDLEPISSSESVDWFNNGIELCQKVYGKNYNVLKDRFMSMSPEIFRWMVIEGYGKVLTRPGLSQIERELAEVAALIVDKRQRQLVSHLIGSLNVGAPIELIRLINKDIRIIAGDDSFHETHSLIDRLNDKYEAKK